MADPYYPVFLSLRGRRCVIVGGGDVAWRKAESLLDAGALVRVVAPDVCSEIVDLGDRVEIRRAPYDASALDDVMMAVVATNSPEVNQRVAADCRGRGVLCNVVDDPDNCDFIVPSVMRQGPLVIAVSTGGASPSAAARIRRRIADSFGPEYGEWLEVLGSTRRLIQKTIHDEGRRRRVSLRLAEDDVLEAARQGSQALRTKVASILESFLREDEQ